MIAIEEILLDSLEIPLVWQVTRGGDAPIEYVTAWLEERRQQLEAARDRHGAVLLRGFQAIDAAPAFAAVMDVLADELMDYIGGSAPREPVYGRIMSTSYLPPNFSLALHQEMAYQAHRPEALALFCERPPEAGGETPIADARQISECLDADLRARFDAGGVQVVRSLPRDQERDRIPRPWPAVFDTDDRGKVEAIAAEKGWTITWGADDSMHLKQQVLPAFQTHPRTGERVWANQVHYHTPQCMLRWAQRDGREADAARFRDMMQRTPEQLDHVYHRDGTEVSGEDAEHIWEVLLESEIPVRWQRYDVLILDNILAMHGRWSYRGHRRVLSALVKSTYPPVGEHETRS